MNDWQADTLPFVLPFNQNNNAMLPWKVLQRSGETDSRHNRTFNRDKLISELKEMTDQEVDGFCNRYLALEHFHATTVGLFATDKIQSTDTNHFQIKSIDS